MYLYTVKRMSGYLSTFFNKHNHSSVLNMKSNDLLKLDSCIKTVEP